MKNNENKEETKGQETPRLEKIENKDTQGNSTLIFI